jgi:hypothetical protein
MTHLARFRWWLDRRVERWHRRRANQGFGYHLGWHA